MLKLSTAQLNCYEIDELYKIENLDITSWSFDNKYIIISQDNIRTSCYLPFKYKGLPIKIITNNKTIINKSIVNNWCIF